MLIKLLNIFSYLFLVYTREKIYRMQQCFICLITIVDSSTIPFYQKAAMAGMSGACGGFIGTPGDMINVRMQNDMKVCSVHFSKYIRVLSNFPSPSKILNM